MAGGPYSSRFNSRGVSRFTFCESCREVLPGWVAMLATLSTDVGLAFRSWPGVHDISGRRRSAVQRKAVFADEHTLLAGLPASRLGGLSWACMVAGARNACWIIQSGSGDLSHFGGGCDSVPRQLARLSDAVPARGKAPNGQGGAPGLSWFAVVGDCGQKQADLLSIDLLPEQILRRPIPASRWSHN